LNKKKFTAILPCRVGGTRLYGKPMQLLDIENRITILEYLVSYLKQSQHIDSVCLAIANGKENHVFAKLAEKNDWKYVFGEENDMLGRTLKAVDKFNVEIMFINSTESPFLFYDHIDKLYEQHVEDRFDLSFFSHLPDGAGYHIINTSALRKSYKNASDRHKELLTAYIFDNKEQFKLNIRLPENKLRRSDIRITVDYPEDLVFCRKVYKDLQGYKNLIKISDIVDYWDKNEIIRKPVSEIGVDWGHGRIWE